jgi:hypothetical protein
MPEPGKDGGVDFRERRRSLGSWFLNLDQAVLNALDFFARRPPPRLSFEAGRRYVGLGSGNAYETVRILLSDRDAVFAHESNCREVLGNAALSGNDEAVLVSASGKKDAEAIAEQVKRKGMRLTLLTCAPDAPAARFLKEAEGDRKVVFERIAEPYTYNTVTYLGMILARTGESAGEIRRHIEERVKPLVGRSFGRQRQFYFLVPSRFDVARRMFEVKFQELFGRRVGRDFFTPEFANKHATDVIPGEGELSVYLGEARRQLERPGRRKIIPLPEGAAYGAAVATGYYVIGRIQAAHPPHFRRHVIGWCERRGIDPLVAGRSESQVHC